MEATNFPVGEGTSPEDSPQKSIPFSFYSSPVEFYMEPEFLSSCKKKSSAQRTRQTRLQNFEKTVNARIAKQGW